MCVRAACVQGRRAAFEGNTGWGPAEGWPTYVMTQGHICSPDQNQLRRSSQKQKTKKESSQDVSQAREAQSTLLPIREAHVWYDSGPYTYGAVCFHIHMARFFFGNEYLVSCWKFQMAAEPNGQMLVYSMSKERARIIIHACVQRVIMRKAGRRAGDGVRLVA